MPDERTEKRRRFKKRYVVLLVLLIGIGLVLSPVVLISIATPGVVGEYPRKMRALVESAQPEDPEGEDAQSLIMRAADAIDEALAPIQADTSDRLVEQRLDEWFATPEIRPDLMWEDAEDPDRSGEDEPWRDAAVSYNAMMRDASERAYSAIEDAGVFGMIGLVSSRSPSALEVPDGPLFDILLPELSPARELARWEQARMRRAATAWDWETFLASLENVMNLSEAVSRSPVIISGLVGYAIEGIGLSELIRVAGELPEPALARAAELIGEGPRSRSILHGIEGEKLFLLDVIDRTHSDNGRGDGWLLPVELVWLSGDVSKIGRDSPSPLNVPGLFFPRKSVTTRIGIGALEGLEKSSEILAQQRPPVRPDIEGNPLLEIMTPALRPMLTANDRAVTHRWAARVVVAIERHRHATGGLPPSIAALRPEYLAGEPIDMFSADGAFVYRANPTTAGEYTLYSVGENFVDDGGRPGKACWGGDLDAVFVPWVGR